MFDDIVRLQVKYQAPRESKVIMRTAAMDSAYKLLKTGKFTPEELNFYQGTPISIAKAERAKLIAERAGLTEQEQGRRRYLSSLRMDLPGQLAHFTIFEK